MHRLLPLVVLCSACAADPEPAIPEGASPAADALIDAASTPEEKAQLTAVRDEVDAAKRAEAEALDAEIARLEKENEALRSRK